MSEYVRGDRSALQRHGRGHPCPICGGHAGLVQGRGIRCAGFTLDRVCYCTREEHAGTLPLEVNLSPPAYKHSLVGRCGCGTEHGWQAFAAPPPPRESRRSKPETLPLDERHEIYTYALGLLDLRPEGLRDLTRRGLSPETAVDLGYRSLPRRGSEAQEFMRRLADRFGDTLLRRCPGFTDKNDRLTFWTSSGQRDGYVVPYRDERGRITGLQAKLLGGKYLTARGTRVADVYHVAGSASGDLYLTEGATKANVAFHVGGLWVFAVPGQSLALRHVEAIKGLKPERVIVALDREDNANTDRARERWLRVLWAADLSVYEAVWEGEGVGGPKGLDDLVAGDGRPRVRGVAFAPPEIGSRRRVLPSVAPGPVAEGGTIDEARELTAKAVDSFLRHPRRNAGRALLVRTPPGAGKTYAVGRVVAAHQIAARVVVGTTRLPGR